MAVSAWLCGGVIYSENSQEAKELHDKKFFGKKLSDGRVQLSWLEGCYLVEKNKIAVFDGRNRKLSFEQISGRAVRSEHDFWIRFAVFRDFLDRGYVVKTGLKFGADFRVYGKGVKPGQEHAMWLVFPVRESDKLTWQDFSAKNRVAHSTKKKLLIAVVDDELDVSYWEVSWLRP